MNESEICLYSKVSKYCSFDESKSHVYETGAPETERRGSIRIKARTRKLKLPTRSARFRGEEVQRWCEADGRGNRHSDPPEYREGGEL